MVKTFDTPELTNIQRAQLNLNPGELSGDLVSGGTITNFSSNGIKDLSNTTSLIVENDKITVKKISLEKIQGPEEGYLEVRGDMKIYGILDAGLVRTTEVLSTQKYEKQYLEFANPNGTVGTGLLWPGGSYNKQLILRNSPDRLWSTENFDLAADRNYMINSNIVLTANSLGNDITTSNLQKIGTLKSLNVSGEVNIADHIFFNPVSQRLGIGTDAANGLLSIYDYVNDVELIIDTTNNASGRFGTYSNRSLEFITDNQTRIMIDQGGNVTIGQEQRDTNLTRVYGKFSVGVKNPREQFEVAGNIRFSNKLFTVDNHPPSEGYFKQGDIVWNSDPKSNAYIGWVCTASGSPGLWKPFGLIAS